MSRIRLKSIFFLTAIRCAFGIDYCSGVAFDANVYRSANPDLVSYNDDQICAHWRDHGVYESRYASTLAFMPLYLVTNGDVYTYAKGRCEAEWAQNVCNIPGYPGLCPRPLWNSGVDTCIRKKGLEHWINYGSPEGRDKLFQGDPQVFEPVSYLQNNPDLVADGYSATTAISHWLLYGLAEGRKSSNSFDVGYYSEQNQEVVAFANQYCSIQFGAGYYDEYRIQPYSGCVNSMIIHHYLRHGVAEGRKGVP